MFVSITSYITTILGFCAFQGVMETQLLGLKEGVKNVDNVSPRLDKANNLTNW